VWLDVGYSNRAGATSSTPHFYNLNIYNSCCGFYKTTTPCVAGSSLLSTAKSTMLFPTPVGKSYSCQSQTSVKIRDGDMKATLFLERFKLQAFISKSDFGPGKVFFPILSSHDIFEYGKCRLGYNGKKKKEGKTK